MIATVIAIAKDARRVAGHRAGGGEVRPHDALVKGNRCGFFAGRWFDHGRHLLCAGVLGAAGADFWYLCSLVYCRRLVLIRLFEASSQPTQQNVSFQSSRAGSGFGATPPHRQDA